METFQEKFQKFFECNLGLGKIISRFQCDGKYNPIIVQERSYKAETTSCSKQIAAVLPILQLQTKSLKNSKIKFDLLGRVSRI